MLDEASMLQAASLSPVDYRQAHGSRKSYVELNNEVLCLNELYASYSNNGINYACFRSRLIAYSKRANNREFDFDPLILKWAGTLDSKEWSLVVGAGRSNPFEYTGKEFWSKNGITFCSLFHFLKTIDRTESFKLIRSRLKQNWPIDRALTESPHNAPDGSGCVYCLTCGPAGQKYIGITVCGIERRFEEHIREYKSGSNRYLYQALREFGSESFLVVVLEENILSKDLGQAEKDTIKKLNTIYPNGLNANAGGQTCNTGGRETVYDGVTYPSIKAAAKSISQSTGSKVPAYVIESRIRRNDTECLTRKCRRVSKHPDAGKPLFRRHKSLIRTKHNVGSSWKDYDSFKRDVLRNISLEQVVEQNLVLSKIDASKPYSGTNFKWIPKNLVTVKRCGQECVVDGVKFASVEAVARSYHIPASSLRYTMKSRSVGVQDAVRIILNNKWF